MNIFLFIQHTSTALGKNCGDEHTKFTIVTMGTCTGKLHVV